MARVVFRIIIATLLIITGLSLYNVFFPLAIQYGMSIFGLFL